MVQRNHVPLSQRFAQKRKNLFFLFELITFRITKANENRPIQGDLFITYACGNYDAHVRMNAKLQMLSRIVSKEKQKRKRLDIQGNQIHTLLCLATVLTCSFEALGFAPRTRGHRAKNSAMARFRMSEKGVLSLRR